MRVDSLRRLCAGRPDGLADKLGDIRRFGQAVERTQKLVANMHAKCNIMDIRGTAK